MEKTDFQKTEGLLFSYFDDIKEIERINRMIEDFENDKKELRNKYKSDAVGSFDYGKPSIQNNTISDSTADIVIKNTEIQDRIAEIDKDIRKLRKSIDDIKYKNRRIKTVINQYEDAEERFIYYKYYDGFGLGKIAELTSWSFTTIRRKRSSIVKKVGNSMNMFKIIS